MMEHTTVPAQAPHAKQYVFVDEYNRHKRLKVMRACDGCRKRKIRCDGALQNGPWPCGACVRLKLKCVPPTLDQDEDSPTPTTDFTPGQNKFYFQNTTLTTNFSKPTLSTASPAQTNYSWSASARTPLSTAPTSAPSLHENADGNPFNTSQPFSQNQYAQGSDPSYSEDEYFGSATNTTSRPLSRSVPSLTRAQTELSESSSGDPEEVDAAVKDLTNQMGDLRVDITSMAPWIANHGRGSYAPAIDIDEDEITLPASVMSDTKVRIPPEMMPHDERVMDYLGYYFDYIHPYIPVLSKKAFYEQWRTARETISPLILEGIFACVARYLDSPTESKRWLALARKHEESYKDVPTISTVQAMVILIKAREFVPKRGYFYRSWMATKYMITMAMDLGLHEHHDQHKEGTPCRLSRSDCIVHTRIWQTLFALEVFIGGPQGRSDFIMRHEDVDMDPPFPSADIDAFEYQISRRYAILSQAVKNTKITNNLFQTMKRKKKDWALDPMFREHDKDLVGWLRELPVDMQIHYPEDGSPPWLGGDHFVAGVHSYHHLLVIMHHRPQLVTLLEKKDPSWTVHLDICFQSAVSICKLQEALLRDFGLHGLLFMLRGINFTVYCVLTCTMLHLVAITSPDYAMNSQARTYFTRHMRVLEQCMTSTGPEVQGSIDALRQAFSLDTSKPFELKPTLGMRSPTMEHNTTPPMPPSQTVPPSLPQGSTPVAQSWTHLQSATVSKAISPAHEYPPSYGTSNIASTMPNHPTVPYGATDFDVATSASYQPQSLNQVSNPGYQQQPYALEPVISNEQTTPVWDPSLIFSQWNTAFGNPSQPPHPSPPETRYAQPMPTSSVMQQPSHASPTTGVGAYVPGYMGGNHPQQMPQPMPDTTAHHSVQQQVTPVMWQDAFTSAYVSGHGQKRHRDDNTGGYDAFGTKRRG